MGPAAAGPKPGEKKKRWYQTEAGAGHLAEMHDVGNPLKHHLPTICHSL